MSLTSLARLLMTYHRARHGYRFTDRAALEQHQANAMRSHLNRVTARSPFYARWRGRPVDEFPVVDKVAMLANFDTMNTVGLSLSEVMAVAERGERTRDFRPQIDKVSVGLSTGTSGRRGVFVADETERMTWAGMMLGRMLPGSLLHANRVAFFLRANNSLYESVSGKGRISFRFFDLLKTPAQHFADLRRFEPTILIGPPGVLRELAKLQRRDDRVSPRKVISVAEALFDDDRVAIERAFGVGLDQVYQCTEGFLGYTCRCGSLHLNEAFVHIAPEWLDEARTQFRPIVTDFNRTTQPIIRYRLDDVLTPASIACVCGSSEMRIERIDGRCDDLLSLPGRKGAIRVVPDFVARAVLEADPRIEDFTARQVAPDIVRIALKAKDADVIRPDVERALSGLWDRVGACGVRVEFDQYEMRPATSKRRRVARSREIAL